MRASTAAVSLVALLTFACASGPPVSDPGRRDFVVDEKEYREPPLLVLRIDAATPWSEVRAVLPGAHPQSHTLARITIVSRNGEPEGALTIRLPTPFRHPIGSRPRTGDYLRVTNRFVTPVDPDALRGHLSGGPVRVVVDTATPVGYLARVFRVIADSGCRGAEAVCPEHSGPVPAGPPNGGYGLRLNGDPIHSPRVSEPTTPGASGSFVIGLPLQLGTSSTFRIGEGRDRMYEWVHERGGNRVDVLWIRAVLHGLAALQLEDGSWIGRQRVVSTSLAVFVLLASGQTHKSGEQYRAVKDGLRFLKRRQDGLGRFSGNSLAHLLTTCVMWRAYERTGSPLYKMPMLRALEGPRARR